MVGEGGHMHQDIIEGKCREVDIRQESEQATISSVPLHRSASSVQEEEVCTHLTLSQEPKEL